MRRPHDPSRDSAHEPQPSRRNRPIRRVCRPQNLNPAAATKRQRFPPSVNDVCGSDLPLSIWQRRSWVAHRHSRFVGERGPVGERPAAVSRCDGAAPRASHPVTGQEVMRLVPLADIVFRAEARRLGPPVRFEFDVQGESAVGVSCSDRAGERGSRGRQITSAARPWRMLQARNR